MKLTLHHINITGADVPAMDHFYGQVLGQAEIIVRAEIDQLTPVTMHADGIQRPGLDQFTAQLAALEAGQFALGEALQGCRSGRHKALLHRLRSC